MRCQQVIDKERAAALSRPYRTLVVGHDVLCHCNTHLLEGQVKIDEALAHGRFERIYISRVVFPLRRSLDSLEQVLGSALCYQFTTVTVKDAIETVFWVIIQGSDHRVCILWDERREDEKRR